MYVFSFISESLKQACEEYVNNPHGAAGKIFPGTQESNRYNLQLFFDLTAYAFHIFAINLTGSYCKSSGLSIDIQSKITDLPYNNVTIYNLPLLLKASGTFCNIFIPK
jgi:hypothetical protein